MAEPLKHHFDRALAEQLCAALEAAGGPKFSTTDFSDTLVDGFDDLELKDRINFTADEIRHRLPDDYPEALQIVVAAATADSIEGFSAWPLCSFVERHGVDHPAASLDAMAVLTTRFSCEFAIRPFLDHHLDLTLGYLHRWVEDPDPLVRRLPSEGTRPALPWGPKVAALSADPELGIALLTKLRHDPDEVVRRSVANHLNDIARHHPDRVVELTRAWSEEDETKPAMVRHALRSLVKKGHTGALEVLGFTTDPAVEIRRFAVSPAQISLGDHITLDAQIVSADPSPSREQTLVIDFVVHHVAARAGADTNAKTFKWTTIQLDGPTAEATLTKRRKIATASTRRYHAGVHRVELLVAGQVMAEAAFTLLDSSVLDSSG